jgi:membrane protein implicated in regulation of membrane protease activity
MLILGIILTILGIIVLQWMAKAMSEPFYNRPLILYRTIPTLIITLLWIGLLIGGLYSFWQVSSKIVFFIVGGFVTLYIVNHFLGSYKNRAKKFFQIYKQLKVYRPRTKEEDILRETVILYAQNLHWDEERIDSALRFIFDEKERKVKDVKDLLNSLFILENSSDVLGYNFNFKKYMKESSRKEAAIDWAYKKVFGEERKISKRPVLSEDSLKRMRESGLNPDEMSNEQLAALEGMGNTEKSHWSVKIFCGIGAIFGFSAVVGLFSLDFVYSAFSAIASLVSMYIGYRIQRRISGKKFHEASVLKWSQEQQQKERPE